MTAAGKAKARVHQNTQRHEDQVTTHARDKKKENKFEAKSYSDNFYADATHEKVSVNYYKYHDYAMFKNKDEFWKSTFKQFQDRNTSLVIKSKVKTEVKGGEMYDLILTDTNSIQCIYERIIMKDGAFY